MGCSQRKIRALPALAALVASAVPLTGIPDDGKPVQVGRYATMAPVPRTAEVHPLHTVISVTFPGEVRKVGDALSFLLRRSGYRLAPTEAADPAADVLMDHTLPAVHRRLGPITLMRALTTLAGPAWKLVVDPVHRLVSFDLAPQYSAITRSPAVHDSGDVSHKATDQLDEGNDCHGASPCGSPSR
ncbi:MAG: pili assembly chaperone [Gammaproteobacteria bacterium]|nr:pili assembly chaperone [Gammaproteobacteria bacterium]